MNCPKCGAIESEEFQGWACGTMNLGYGQIVRSSDCRIRELEGRVRTLEAALRPFPTGAATEEDYRRAAEAMKGKS